MRTITCDVCNSLIDEENSPFYVSLLNNMSDDSYASTIFFRFLKGKDLCQTCFDIMCVVDWEKEIIESIRRGIIPERGDSDECN
jgi:hypothetical protein